MTIQEVLKKQVLRKKSFRKKLIQTNVEIDKLSRMLLKKLQQITGWEVMIDEEYLWDYERDTDNFFNRCQVIALDTGKVEFVFNYDDGVSTALTISLDAPLEEQVRMAISKKEGKEMKDAEQEREKELAELERLKKKYESK